MMDNIIFKIIRKLSKPYIRTITHYSDGKIIMSEANPNPLFQETKIVDVYVKERSK